jgi:hypothetical protein
LFSPTQELGAVIHGSPRALLGDLHDLEGIKKHTRERRGGTDMMAVYLFSLAAVDIYALDAVQNISHTAARI